jgi:hypothetical protein
MRRVDDTELIVQLATEPPARNGTARPAQPAQPLAARSA